MVQGPWLVIMDSRHKMKDKITFVNFKTILKCRFMVGTPQTGGYGITLTQANTVIYYSNGYDLEKSLQSEDRAHSIGQKKTVTYIDMIAEKLLMKRLQNLSK